MEERELVIKNRLGLHARAAAKFAETASRFKSSIKVSKDGMEVDGKSIMGLLTLVACKGSKLLVRAHGPDEKEALDEIEKLIEDRFGEEE